MRVKSKYLAKCDEIPFCKKSANLESNNTNNGSNFANLPSEIILTVFNHLNQSDLARCARVCRRFRDLTTADCLWMGKAKESLATNCQDSEMKSKSVQPWISAQDRVRLFDKVIFFMLLYSIFMELQCLSKKTRFFCLLLSKTGSLQIEIKYAKSPTRIWIFWLQIDMNQIFLIKYYKTFNDNL